MRSAASRTPRRSAGLAAVALAMLWLTTGSAAAQTCLPEPPPQQPPPPQEPPPPLLPPPPLGAQPRAVAAAVTSVSEGAGSVTFTLSLPADQCTAKISYQTADGTATAGQDYGARSGTVDVSFTDPEARVTVPIVDDALDEADETFSLQVKGGDGGGTMTIVDNDPPPSISVGNPSIAEGTGTGGAEVFPVSLSAPSGQPVTVNYATADATAVAGSDYQPTSGTLTFPPGTTKQSVAVPLMGDSAPEPDETFDLVLSAPRDATLATTTAVGTIVNDDGRAGQFGGPSQGGPPVPPLGDVGPPLLVISPPVQADGALTWTITCPVTAQSCTGRVKVTTDLARRAAAAVAAKRKPHLVKLGSQNYSLNGGQTKKVRVRINAKGRRLIRKRHNVPADATFKTRDRSGHVSQRTQHITLHPVILRHS